MKFPKQIQLLVTKRDIVADQRNVCGERSTVCPIAQSAARRFNLPDGMMVSVGYGSLQIETRDALVEVATYLFHKRVGKFIRRADCSRRAKLTPIRFTIRKMK